MNNVAINPANECPFNLTKSAHTYAQDCKQQKFSDAKAGIYGELNYLAKSNAYINRQYLADTYGVKVSTVNNLISEFIKRGFGEPLEIAQNNKVLKITTGENIDQLSVIVYDQFDIAREEERAQNENRSFSLFNVAFEKFWLKIIQSTKSLDISKLYWMLKNWKAITSEHLGVSISTLRTCANLIKSIINSFIDIFKKAQCKSGEAVRQKRRCDNANQVKPSIYNKVKQKIYTRYKSSFDNLKANFSRSTRDIPLHEQLSDRTWANQSKSTRDMTLNEELNDRSWAL